jgi:ElaB/YqjD/DUF883 family membrane-anchored ribosome-binding protein
MDYPHLAGILGALAHRWPMTTALLFKLLFHPRSGRNIRMTGCATLRRYIMENTSHGSDGKLGKALVGAHGAVDKAAGIADEAVRKMKPAIDRIADGAHHAVDKAASAANQPVEWLSEQGDNLVATQKRIVLQTGDYVSAHPLKALGAALAIGLLIGRVLS